MTQCKYSRKKAKHVRARAVHFSLSQKNTLDNKVRGELFVSCQNDLWEVVSNNENLRWLIKWEEVGTKRSGMSDWIEISNSGCG